MQNKSKASRRSHAKGKAGVTETERKTENPQKKTTMFTVEFRINTQASASVCKSDERERERKKYCISPHSCPE